MNDEALIAARTQIAAPSLLPEISLHVAAAIVPLWEETSANAPTPPPYWGFPWVGGQALARHLLDNPALVANKRVLDLGTGSGLVAIAAARAGAANVVGTDIDPRAILVAEKNAALNGVSIELIPRDILDDTRDEDVILGGDLCYEQPLARRVLSFLRRHAMRSVVLVGDAGRVYFAPEGLELLARYDVPTTRELEGREVRAAAVYRMR
jgi:predicted nicotinamide N-methyase